MAQQKKNIAITLQEAKKWYHSDNQTLKELALKAFSKEELDFIGLPKTWEKYIEEEHKNNAMLQTKVLTHMIRTKDEQLVSILKGNDIDNVFFHDIQLHK